MRIAFRNFTGGEVTPTLSARYDLNKSGSFMSCCLNFIPNLHGDIERRPGTRFVAGLGAPSVLIPFQFNTEPGNNYVIIFQEGSIKVASADGLLPDAVLASPYGFADARKISYAQAGDVLYLAHKDFALRKLTRSGAAPDYEWQLEEVALNRSLPAPGAPLVEFVRDNAEDEAGLSHTLNYVVTAVDAAGVESLASAAGECQGKYPTDWVVGNHVRLSWQAVDGAVEYNVYRECAGYYGLIGVASGKDTTGGTLSGLGIGSAVAPLSHFGGKITRTVVIGNGHTQSSDVSSGLTVAADAGKNSFLFDGHLFVKVTLTTLTTEWKPAYNDEGDLEYEPASSTSREDFWAMLECGDEPAGQYSQWTRGDGDGEAPRGVFGPYTVAPAHEGATSIVFTDQNYEADTAKTPAEDWNPFADGNYPGVVTFHQQRLVLGGTRRNPASFYMSRSGDYECFRKSRPLMDDDPVEYMLASGSIDEIMWMASFGDLVIGTSGAEYKATSSGAAITPSDIQISVQSYWGSSGILPLIIGQSVLHCQRSGCHVRDLFYSWESDGYAGNDLSLLAPQLVENGRIVQWAYQQSPGSNIWAVREDGALLCLTYMKEQNVFGWSRHGTDGKVLSCAVICGEEEDVLMLVVERGAGDHKGWFLERLAGRFREADPIENAFFVDCGVARRQEASRECGGLSHLEGREVVALADGSPVHGLVVEDGKVRLPWAASRVIAGLPYESALSPLPIETDSESGSTLARRRAYGKCALRVFRSAGGSYAASEPGDLFEPGSWRERKFYDLPYLSDAIGGAQEPFSGDLEICLPGGQDGDASIWVRQDEPLPLRLIAILCDVNFGEMQ